MLFKITAMRNWLNIYVLRKLFNITAMRNWLNIYVLRMLFYITAMRTWTNIFVLRMLFNITAMRNWTNIFVLREMGILYFLAFPKCNLGDVEKAMMQVVPGPFVTIFVFRLFQIRLLRGLETDDWMGCVALTRHIILPGLYKIRLRRSRERFVASGHRTLSTHFRLQEISNTTIGLQ